MWANIPKHQIHLDWCPKSFLLADRQLDLVQEILREHAPKWSAGLHLYRYPRQRHPIEVTAPGALAEIVRNATVREPQYYQQLRDRGCPSVRVTGSAELRGVDSSLVVVVGVDEYPIAACGDEWHWGNGLSITITRRRVEGMDAVAWSARVFESVCEALSPWHAFGTAFAEFDAKNMSHEGGGLAAIGRNIAAGLPGLYWVNFFGQPYRELIGRDRLFTAPAHQVREVDDGVLLMIHPEPQAWDTPEYRMAEDRILAHVGRRFFFAREDPDRETAAPPFDLPPLAPIGQRGPFRVYYPGGNG
jgi:hypothetical protein